MPVLSLAAEIRQHLPQRFPVCTVGVTNALLLLGQSRGQFGRSPCSGVAEEGATLTLFRCRLGKGVCGFDQQLDIPEFR